MAQVHVKALSRAAGIVGGAQALALRLGVTPSHLALWMDGVEAPPDHIFLKIVDLISDEQIASLAKRPPQAGSRAE